MAETNRATSICQDLERESQSALRSVDRACEAAQNAFHLETVPLLRALRRNLTQLVNLLKSPEMDSLSDEEVNDLVQRLQLIRSRIGEMVRKFESLPASRRWPYRDLLADIEHGGEYLYHATEGLRLSSHREFRDVVKESITELKGALEPDR
jgi:hypothetical protein